MLSQPSCFSKNLNKDQETLPAASWKRYRKETKYYNFPLPGRWRTNAWQIQHTHETCFYFFQVLTQEAQVCAWPDTQIPPSKYQRINKRLQQKKAHKKFSLSLLHLQVRLQQCCEQEHTANTANREIISVAPYGKNTTEQEAVCVYSCVNSNTLQKRVQSNLFIRQHSHFKNVLKLPHSMF